MSFTRQAWTADVAHGKLSKGSSASIWPEHASHVSGCVLGLSDDGQQEQINVMPCALDRACRSSLCANEFLDVRRKTHVKIAAAVVATVVHVDPSPAKPVATGQSFALRMSIKISRGKYQ